MAALAEAYIQLRPFYVSRERLEELGKRTDEIALAAAVRIYDQPVAIEVELNEGSLWGKIRVTGAIVFTAYTGYASIDGAIATTERLCKNGKLFGEYVCSAFVKEAGATPDQVFKIEYRLKTPGKLRRALKRVQRLDEIAGNLPPEELHRQLHSVREQFESAMKDLDAEETKALEQIVLKNLGPLKTWPKNDPRAIEAPRIAYRERRQPSLSLKRETVLRELVASPAPATRPKLRYHNKFVVSKQRTESVRGSLEKDMQ